MARNFTIKQKDGVSYAVCELDDFSEIQGNYDGQLVNNVFVMSLSSDDIEQLKKDGHADNHDIDQLKLCDKAIFGSFDGLEEFISGECYISKTDRLLRVSYSFDGPYARNKHRADVVFIDNVYPAGYLGKDSVVESENYDDFLDLLQNKFDSMLVSNDYLIVPIDEKSHDVVFQAEHGDSVYMITGDSYNKIPNSMPYSENTKFPSAYLSDIHIASTMSYSENTIKFPIKPLLQDYYSTQQLSNFITSFEDMEFASFNDAVEYFTYHKADDFIQEALDSDQINEEEADLVKEDCRAFASRLSALGYEACLDIIDNYQPGSEQPNNNTARRR
jgi:hypothetical protein